VCALASLLSPCFRPVSQSKIRNFQRYHHHLTHSTTMGQQTTKTFTFWHLLVILVALSSISTTSVTPKDMLSSPRCSAAIPNPNGTIAVYTQTIYSFDTDAYSGGIYLLEVSSSKSSASSKLIIDDTNASDPIWLYNRTILY